MKTQHAATDLKRFLGIQEFLYFNNGVAKTNTYRINVDTHDVEMLMNKAHDMWTPVMMDSRLKERADALLQDLYGA